MAENTNAQAPTETGPEMLVYTVSCNLTTGELVARDLRGVELARVDTTEGGDADEHAEVARKAAETLAAWYN